METKADIRRQMLALRKQMSLEEQRNKSRVIQKKVLACLEFQKAEWIFLYMDCKGEVQTKELLMQCLKQEKHVALPRVCSDEMDFYEVKSIKDVEPGYFGILEPTGKKKIEKPHGFMLVPGVAFSKDGVRLGYGKGFYDRYLKRFPDLYTCAAAYAFQVADSLPFEEHDIKLKEIITEREDIKC